MSDWLGDVMSGASKGSAIGSIVPGVGTLVGAGVGAAISLAMDLVPDKASVFGVNKETAQKVIDTVERVTGTTSPTRETLDQTQIDDLRVQLMQIANEAEDRRQQTFIAELTQQVSNTANARMREIELAKVNSKLPWVSVFVDAFVLSLFGGVVFFVLLHGITETGMSRDMIVGFIGTISTLAVMVVQYHRGSSAGSAAKDERLANSVPSHLLPEPASIVPAADVNK